MCSWRRMGRRCCRAGEGRVAKRVSHGSLCLLGGEATKGAPARRVWLALESPLFRVDLVKAAYIEIAFAPEVGDVLASVVIVLFVRQRYSAKPHTLL